MANAVGAAHATPLNDARALTERGFSVVPVPFRSKKSVLTGWPDLRLTLDRLPEHFGKPNASGSSKRDDKPKPPAKREWTPEAFGIEFVGKTPIIEEEIFARAAAQGIKKTQADSLLQRGLASHAVFRHSGSGYEKHRFATIPPDIFNSKAEGGAGMGGVSPPTPVLSARGGVGGDTHPPLPPPSTRNGKTKATAKGGKKSPSAGAAEPASPRRGPPPSQCRMCGRNEFVVPVGGGPEDWMCGPCHGLGGTRNGGQERPQGGQQ